MSETTMTITVRLDEAMIEGRREELEAVAREAAMGAIIDTLLAPE